MTENYFCGKNIFSPCRAASEEQNSHCGLRDILVLRSNRSLLFYFQRNWQKRFVGRQTLGSLSLKKRPLRKT